MNIIDDLAKSSIGANKKDSLATRLSILLAVVLLGTILFIIGSLKRDIYRGIISTVGDYQMSLSQVDRAGYEKLRKNDKIEKARFDKVISTDLNAVIYEKEGDWYKLEGLKILKGRKPSKADELMVPDRFLLAKDYKLGDRLKAGGKAYQIVGTYEDRDYSFDEALLLGFLERADEKNLYKDDAGVVATVWYKSPRDTYTNTKALLKDLGIDYERALSTGQVSFNTGLLESKMIYPSGLIPPKRVVEDAVETYGVCFLLTILFAVMIYGAFNVWNNRDMKEIALLKSVGMTEKQVRKMVRRKSFGIAYGPVFLGAFLAYWTANLLLYFMWLNNKLSYEKLSSIFGQTMQAPDFHLIYPQISVLFVLLFFSFLTVYFSGILPARRSAKLNVIDGLNENFANRDRVGKSKLGGPVEKSLAGDYYRAYRGTYKTILWSMILSALALNFVLVSQSYKDMEKKYNSYHSSYNFTSTLLVPGTLNKDLLQKMEDLKGPDALHIYGVKDFKFFLKDNPHFISKDLEKALESGEKSKDRFYARIYGLADKDFDRLLKEKGYDRETSYLLLNKIGAKDRSPYAFQSYIPISKEDKGEVQIRYSMGGKVMTLPLGGSLDKMPYDLAAYDKNGIFIFTRNKTLEEFIAKNGRDPGEPSNCYEVKLRAGKNKEKIFDQAEKIISSYIPKTDHLTSSDLLEQAADAEESRNEHLLNGGLQVLLLILAISNAYNSFHGNLRARKRDFQLLETAGMTEKQMKKMVYGESKILFGKALAAYLFIFVLALFVRARRSAYPLGFAMKELLTRLNYLPLLLVFLFMGLGIVLSIQSGLKTLLEGQAIKDL